MPTWETDFASETVLPSQFAARGGGAEVQAEKRLQSAVLADAILTFRRCVCGASSRAGRLFAEVDAWFESDDASGPFTFVTICDTLGFEPGYIRRGLAAWRTAEGTPRTTAWAVRRSVPGTRHQIVAPRLKRVA